MIQFRNLNPDEVDVRIGSIGKNGEWITLLLYKDARCDMSILDETVGPENWQRDHFECKGNLYCKVGINTNYKDPKAVDRWIWKADCGAESRTEAEKGEASDSFKRACVNWGIGRELYTSPPIFVKNIGKDGSANFDVDDSGRLKTKFKVSCMRIENKKIVALSIERTKPSRTVFTFGDCFPEEKTTKVDFSALLEEAKRTGKSLKAILATVKNTFPDAPKSINDLTPEQLNFVLEKLRGVPDAGT